MHIFIQQIIVKANNIKISKVYVVVKLREHIIYLWYINSHFVPDKYSIYYVIYSWGEESNGVKYWVSGLLRYALLNESTSVISLLYKTGELKLKLSNSPVQRSSCNWKPLQNEDHCKS